MNIASSTNGYVLAHRGTRPSFKNRGYLAIWLSGYVVEDGKRLFNPYGVMVNPARQPHVKVQLAQAFADWIVSAADQALSRITR